MSPIFLHLFLFAGSLAVSGCRPAPPDGVSVIAMPDGESGIGFDDLRFAPKIGRLMVPGGRSGHLDLIDPQTHKVTTSGDFSSEIFYFGGHDQGATSADEADDLLVVIDRTTNELGLIDSTARKVIYSISVSSSPGYVRYVASSSEVWVTEPDAAQIEIFSLGNRTLTRSGTIALPTGAQSLVVDSDRTRAYSHHRSDATDVVDTATRQIVATWPNGCAAARGIAIDLKLQFLFAVCDNGKVSVLDGAHDGAVLSTLQLGSGTGTIDYSSSLGHLYVASAGNQKVAIIDVASDGTLSLLDQFTTIDDASSVGSDNRRVLYVGDPQNGDLLAYADSHAASAR